MDNDLRQRRELNLDAALVEITQLLHLLADYGGEDFAVAPQEGQDLIRAIRFFVDDLQAARKDLGAPDFRKRHEARLRLGLRRIDVQTDGFFLAVKERCVPG